MTLPRDPNTKKSGPELASAEVNARSKSAQVDDSDDSNVDDAEDDGDDGDVDDAEDDGATDDDAPESAQPMRDSRRAAFLDDLPDVPELRPLIAAFVAGNYARLRELSEALPRNSDEEVLAGARELVGRTQPDPLAKKLLWLSIAFFAALVSWVYLHHAH